MLKLLGAVAICNFGLLGVERVKDTILYTKTLNFYLSDHVGGQHQNICAIMKTLSSS